MIYVGANGRTTLSAGRKLARSWVVQPKLDGMYVELHTDRSGRIFEATSRTGKPVRTQLDGVRTGCSYAVLVGELEAHTEAGIRVAGCRGYQCASVFDILQLSGRSLAELPYAERRDALYRARAVAQDATADQPWADDARGCAHDRRGRYCQRIPMGWRRLPIVPQRPAQQLVDAWDEWVQYGGGEGVVLVNTRARAGARRAKLKIKPIHTIDAVVCDADEKAAVLIYAGHTFAVACSKLRLRIGDIVEVQHDGWYEQTVTPRNARVLRVRSDLA